MFKECMWRSAPSLDGEGAIKKSGASTLGDHFNFTANPHQQACLHGRPSLQKKTLRKTSNTELPETGSASRGDITFFTML